MLSTPLTQASLAKPRLVQGSKEAKEAEAEKNLEIAFGLLIGTQGWGILESNQGGKQSGG